MQICFNREIESEQKKEQSNYMQIWWKYTLSVLLPEVYIHNKDCADTPWSKLKMAHLTYTDSARSLDSAVIAQFVCFCFGFGFGFFLLLSTFVTVNDRNIHLRNALSLGCNMRMALPYTCVIVCGRCKAFLVDAPEKQKHIWFAYS